MKKESKVMALYSKLGRLETVYNNINDINEVHVSIKGDPEYRVITDKEVLDPIKKYYGKQINELKEELKKELDKKL